MRLILNSMLVAGAVFGAVAGAGVSAAHAQSAYDYPWCAVYTNRSGAQACYYASYGQCMDTMRGVGGYCIRSPYYRGAERPHRRERYD